MSNKLMLSTENGEYISISVLFEMENFVDYWLKSNQLWNIQLTFIERQQTPVFMKLAKYSAKLY